MSEDNIVYSTDMSGAMNKFAIQQEAQLQEEKDYMEDFMFSDPVSLDDDYFDQGLFEDSCACAAEYGSFTLTEEDLQYYDDNCEDYEEAKRKRLFEAEEY